MNAFNFIFGVQEVLLVLEFFHVSFHGRLHVPIKDLGRIDVGYSQNAGREKSSDLISP